MSKAKIIDKKSVESILGEKKLLSILHHPFIVNMIYSYQDQDYLYLVMDLLPGGNLRYHLSKMKKFKETQNKFLIACILVGLEYIHSQKILHRDIKPENLVFDENGYLRITDFGIAKKYVVNNKHDTSGTVGYLAPEILCNENHTYTIDYYAIGIITYELAFGRRPYIGKTKHDVKQLILTTQAHVEYDEMEGYQREAADFINRLIKRKQKQRLGREGINDIINHPWFKDFEWEKLKQKKLRSNFIPTKGDNFDKKYCLKSAKIGTDTIERYKKISSRSDYSTMFKEFDTYKIPDEFRIYNNKDKISKIQNSTINSANVSTTNITKNFKNSKNEPIINNKENNNNNNINNDIKEEQTKLEKKSISTIKFNKDYIFTNIDKALTNEKKNLSKNNSRIFGKSEKKIEKEINLTNNKQINSNQNNNNNIQNNNNQIVNEDKVVNTKANEIINEESKKLNELMRNSALVDSEQLFKKINIVEKFRTIQKSLNNNQNELSSKGTKKILFREGNELKDSKSIILKCKDKEYFLKNFVNKKPDNLILNKSKSEAIMNNININLKLKIFEPQKILLKNKIPNSTLYQSKTTKRKGSAITRIKHLYNNVRNSTSVMNQVKQGLNNSVNSFKIFAKDYSLVKENKTNNYRKLPLINNSFSDKKNVFLKNTFLWYKNKRNYFSKNDLRTDRTKFYNSRSLNNFSNKIKDY